jgi:hypothetical protein
MPSTSSARRLALAGAVFTPLALAWLSLGVDIIGADGDPANVGYVGLALAALAGAGISRFESLPTARVMAGAALGVAGIGLVAVVGGIGRPHSGPVELLGLNALFVAAFLATAWLFQRAARGAEPGVPA